MIFLTFQKSCIFISLLMTPTYYKADNMEKLETVINKELRKLGTWLIVNRLSLNIDKTNFLIFHPYNKPLKQRITLKIRKGNIRK